MSQRAAIAVEYERVFAVEAKKRELERKTHQNEPDRTRENLPQSEVGKASDEAGDLFNVSGRSVRDAKYVAENDPDTFAKVKADHPRTLRTASHWDSPADA